MVARSDRGQFRLASNLHDAYGNVKAPLRIDGEDLAARRPENREGRCQHSALVGYDLYFVFWDPDGPTQ